MFVFVLAIGAFIAVVFATGALDRGIGRLAHRLRGRGAVLVAGVMTVFWLLGTVEGFAKETLGFYGLVARETPRSRRGARGSASRGWRAPTSRR